MKKVKRTLLALLTVTLIICCNSANNNHTKINATGVSSNVSTKTEVVVDSSNLMTTDPWCDGNACDDIVRRWDANTRQSKFKNTGSKIIILKIDGVLAGTHQNLILSANEELPTSFGSFSNPIHANYK